MYFSRTELSKVGKGQPLPPTFKKLVVTTAYPISISLTSTLSTYLNNSNAISIVKHLKIHPLKRPRENLKSIAIVIADPKTYCDPDRSSPLSPCPKKSNRFVNLALDRLSRPRNGHRSKKNAPLVVRPVLTVSIPPLKLKMSRYRLCPALFHRKPTPPSRKATFYNF